MTGQKPDTLQTASYRGKMLLKESVWGLLSAIEKVYNMGK